MRSTALLIVLTATLTACEAGPVCKATLGFGPLGFSGEITCDPPENPALITDE